mmetsp:Transcript_5619/g.14040  ORF Transcript_5619/g.14040 Transcript_5619/m.14040 type:complete len:235 (+) Transcript_5619:184-888(+)
MFEFTSLLSLAACSLLEGTGLQHVNHRKHLPLHTGSDLGRQISDTVRRTLRIHIPPLDVVLQLELHAPIGARERVRMERVSAVQRILRHAERQRRLVIAEHLDILLQIERVVAKLLQRGDDSLRRPGRVRLRLLVALGHLQFVPRERRGELHRQVLETGLHGDYLLAHVRCDDRERFTGYHILHELIAIAPRGTHDERQVVLGVKDRVGIDRRRMGVVDRQHVLLPGRLANAGE